MKCLIQKKKLKTAMGPSGLTPADDPFVLSSNSVCSPWFFCLFQVDDG